MNYLQKIVEDIELHSVEGIKECFSNGVNPNDHYRGEPLIYELTSEYARGPKFKECVRAFVDHGLVFEDKKLLSVLLDDPSALALRLIKNPEAVQKNIHFGVLTHQSTKPACFTFVLNSIMFPVPRFLLSMAQISMQKPELMNTVLEDRRQYFIQ
ncbi:MAG TPA: hypothetical protein VFH08_12925 [Chitinophagaceae bacterium]|nr:hypothetical protein [Chitinophagaceae bacterium]